MPPLPLQRPARLYTRMDKGIIPVDRIILQRVEKTAVGVRKPIGELVAQVFQPSAVPDTDRGTHAIAGHGFCPAEIKPSGIGNRVGDEVQHRRFMVAGKEPHLGTGQRARGQPVQHAPAVRATVDIVSEEDQDDVPAGVARGIARDQRQQPVEQKQFPVDVANGIEADVGDHDRDGGDAGRFRSSLAQAPGDPGAHSSAVHTPFLGQIESAGRCTFPCLCPQQGRTRRGPAAGPASVSDGHPRAATGAGGKHRFASSKTKMPETGLCRSWWRGESRSSAATLLNITRWLLPPR